MRPLSVLAVALLALAPAAPLAAQTAPAAGASDVFVIPGVELKRPDGRFLGVETEGARLKVTFYDKEKKKEPADVVRISARWRDTEARFAVLLPSEPETLVSPPMLRRPINYVVILSLVGPDGKVVESHSVRPR